MVKQEQLSIFTWSIVLIVDSPNGLKLIKFRQFIWVLMRIMSRVSSQFAKTIKPLLTTIIGGVSTATRIATKTTQEQQFTPVSKHYHKEGEME